MSVNFHFLNVGDGDCTIVHFPPRTVHSTGVSKNERVMMVDIMHSEDGAYEHVIDYYRDNFPNTSGVKPIFRFVTTHPHKDHITGIRTLFTEAGIPIWNMWDLEHEFEPEKVGASWESFKPDWDAYQALRSLNQEDGLTVRRYWDDQSGIKFWDEDKITILSPSKELHQHAHYKEDGTRRDAKDVQLNSMPYVLLIRVNDTKVLLASDADEACWEYIVENHADEITGVDVLKAAHHGRLSGFHEDAVALMNPSHIVFSMSEETDDDHGADSDYLRVAPDAAIYRTHSWGSVVLECGFDGTITAG